MIWVCEHCGAEIESRRKLYKHKREDHKIKNGQAPKYDLKCLTTVYNIVLPVHTGLELVMISKNFS